MGTIGLCGLKIYMEYKSMSGSLRFSQFSGCWLILSVYIIMSFDFPFVRLFGGSVILLLPLSTMSVYGLLGLNIYSLKKYSIYKP